MFLVPIFIRGHGISNYELPERVMVALFVSYSATWPKAHLSGIVVP